MGKAAGGWVEFLGFAIDSGVMANSDDMGGEHGTIVLLPVRFVPAHIGGDAGDDMGADPADDRFERAVNMAAIDAAYPLIALTCRDQRLGFGSLPEMKGLRPDAHLERRMVQKQDGWSRSVDRQHLIDMLQALRA